MHRIFLPDQPVRDQVVITGDKAGYISQVLRSRPGDTLLIHDNTGRVFRSTIRSASRKEVIAVVAEQVASIPESPVHLRLFQGILKGEKMDLVIQKTVELGVNEIVPVVTERSQVRETRKRARWQKISEEAARQCGRCVIPTVHEVAELSDVFGALRPGTAPGIVLWESGGEDLHASLGRLHGARQIDLLIGPEGGFPKAEVLQATASGFVAATLGRRILRAETAAIAAVALCQFQLGDLGSA